jgi:hypothetical protein
MPSSGQEQAGVAGVYLADLVRVRWLAGGHGSADLGMKAIAGSAGAQTPSTRTTVSSGLLKPCRWTPGSNEHRPIAGFLRLAVSADQQAAAQDVDGLIEFVVRAGGPDRRNEREW